MIVRFGECRRRGKDDQDGEITTEMREGTSMKQGKFTMAQSVACEKSGQPGATFNAAVSAPA